MMNSDIEMNSNIQLEEEFKNDNLGSTDNTTTNQGSLSLSSISNASTTSLRNIKEFK